VIAVNPDKGSQIKIDLANTFIDWLISVPTQEKIAEFGVAEFGAPLFTPDSALWREAQAGEVSAAVALKITGKVDNEMSWTEDEVRAMDTIEAESTNKQGEARTYTGVPIKTLLELAGVQAGAATIVYVADDGTTADTPLTDVQTCEDCIVSFRNQGGFSIVMPGFASKVQVKGVIEIQVQ
jgi:DMSO/TMAO reductase YedYZ molybdopterin-dependent catalytic subunit